MAASAHPTLGLLTQYFSGQHCVSIHSSKVLCIQTSSLIVGELHVSVLACGVLHGALGLKISLICFTTFLHCHKISALLPFHSIQLNQDLLLQCFDYLKQDMALVLPSTCGVSLLILATVFSCPKLLCTIAAQCCTTLKGLHVSVVC